MELQQFQPIVWYFDKNIKQERQTNFRKLQKDGYMNNS